MDFFIQILILTLLSIHPTLSQSSTNITDYNSTSTYSTTPLLSPRLTLLLPLLSQYDDSLRPNLNIKIAEITTSYRLNLLYSIDSREETFALDLFLREEWNDPRLSLNFTTNDYLLLPSTIWKPDTFFLNAIKCITSDSVLRLLNNQGDVRWSRHQLCTFYTPFSLMQFPFDSQILILKRQSLAYGSDDLIIKYPEQNCFLPDPRFEYSSSLWELQNIECQLLQSTMTLNNRPQTTAVSKLIIKRMSESYILKYILPLFMLVFLSCFTYFIDPLSAPARVGFSVSLVLSIVTFNLVVSQDLPKINYSTLLDWYVWKCFLFVIGAVAEFAIVNHILVSKTIDSKIGKLIDDFCGWTLPFVWSLSNLIYWPIIDNDFGRILIGLLLVSIVGLNAMRIVWNYRNDKNGVKDAAMALYSFLRKFFENDIRDELYADAAYGQIRIVRPSRRDVQTKQIACRSSETNKITNQNDGYTSPSLFSDTKDNKEAEQSVSLLDQLDIDNEIKDKEEIELTSVQISPIDQSLDVLSPHSVLSEDDYDIKQANQQADEARNRIQDLLRIDMSELEVKSSKYDESKNGEQQPMSARSQQRSIEDVLDFT